MKKDFRFAPMSAVFGHQSALLETGHTFMCLMTLAAMRFLARRQSGVPAGALMDDSAVQTNTPVRKPISPSDAG